MKQEYNKYTAEDQEVWKILFDRQEENLSDKTGKEYHDCCFELKDSLNSLAILKFSDIDLKLSKNDWSISVVPGLIPVEDFFTLLSKRQFCSSTWLRKRHQLDYLEEPDMFHDIFGHIPLIMNPVYASFMERFGKIGVDNINDKIVLTALQRLYWFTIEFGLIKGEKKSNIYGAGIISSFGETNHIYNDDIEIKKFDIIEVINTPFINSEIQNLYFEINSFEEMYESLSVLEKMIENGLDITPAIVR